MENDLLEESLRRELEALRDTVEELTGLSSRWNGTVVVMESAEIALLQGKALLAEKQWDCTILVNSALAGIPLRWRTLSHEVLHSVSAGINEVHYKQFKGWEEGVVESLQRLLRPQILSHIGVNVPESVFTPVETLWLFNGYIEALESLRNYVELPKEQFYLELIKTPLADRMAAAYRLGSGKEYQRLFALACGKLR
jgi:hypothetical protein